jgi:ribosomal-protein-alanine N-acetyltransferase
MDQMMAKTQSHWLLKPMILATGRLSLHQFTAADVSLTYLRWLNDPEHMRFSNQRFDTHTHDSALEYISSFQGVDAVFLAVEMRDHSQLVGTATVFSDNHHGTADIGVMIGSEYSGQGFAREAVCAIAESLDTQGFRKITMGTSAQNIRMLRVIESLGFKPDGVKVRQEIIDGVETDILYFAKFAQPKLT